MSKECEASLIVSTSLDASEQKRFELLWDDCESVCGDKVDVDDSMNQSDTQSSSAEVQRSSSSVVSCSMRSISRISRASSMSFSNTSVPHSSARGGPADVDDGIFVDIHTNLEKIHALGIRHLQNGEIDDALSVFRQVLKDHSLSTVGGNDTNLILASTHHNLGIINMKRDMNREALSSFVNSIRMHHEILGDKHPVLAKSLVKVGFIQLGEKSYKKASSAFRKALIIRKEHYGTVHPLVAKVYNNLGVVYVSSGKQVEAQKQFEKALDIQRCLLADLYESNPSVKNIENARLEIADTQFNIGSALLDCEDWSIGEGQRMEAEAALSEALAINEGILGSDHKVTKTTRDKFDKSKYQGNSAGVNLTKWSLNKMERSLQDRSRLKNITNVKIKKKPELKKVKESCLPGMVSCSNSSSSSPSLEFPQKPNNDMFISLDNEKGALIPEDNIIGTARSTKKVNSDMLMLQVLENEPYFEDEIGGADWTEQDIQYLIEDVDKNADLIQDAAELCLVRKQYDHALTLLQSLLASYRESVGENHAHVGSTLHSIGVTYLRQHKYKDSLLYFQHAVRVRRIVHGEFHSCVGVSLVKAGISLFFLKEFDACLIIFQESLELRQSALGSHHASIAHVHNNLGCVYARTLQVREARRSFEYALDVQRSTMIEEASGNNKKCTRTMMMEAAVTLMNLGLLYRSRRMYDRSVVLLDEALKLQEEVLGTYHETALSTLDVLADTTERNNDRARALVLYKTLLERFKLNKRYEIGGTSLTLYKMSRVNAKQKDYQACLERLKAARSVLEKEETELGGSTNFKKRTYLKDKIAHDLRALESDKEKLATMEGGDLDWI